MDTYSLSKAGGWSRLSGRIGGLQDLLSAAIFFWVWLDPTGWRHDLVGYGLLAMLMEFALIHASVMFGMARDPGQPHPVAGKAALGMLGFYLLLVAGFALNFDDLWVLAGAAWLLIAKAWPLIHSSADAAAVSYAQRWMWGASVFYYLLAVGATALLPVPRLGITGHGASYGIDGISGLWVSQPQMAVAALTLYFLLIGVTRVSGADQRAADAHHAGLPENNA